MKAVVALLISALWFNFVGVEIYAAPAVVATLTVMIVLVNRVTGAMNVTTGVVIAIIYGALWPAIPVLVFIGLGKSAETEPDKDA